MSKLKIVLFAVLLISEANAYVWSQPLLTIELMARNAINATVSEIQQKFESIEEIYDEMSIDLLANVSKVRNDVDTKITLIQQKIHTQINQLAGSIGHGVNISKCTQYSDYHLNNNSESEAILSITDECIRGTLKAKFDFISNMRNIFKVEFNRLERIGELIQHCVVTADNVESAIEAMLCTITVKNRGKSMSSELVQRLATNSTDLKILVSTVETTLDNCIATNGLTVFQNKLLNVMENTVQCILEISRTN